jgi:magnesium chelatase subunit D
MRAADDRAAAATPGAAAWRQAIRAAEILAVDPMGVRVRARVGAARDRWLDIFQRLLPGCAPVHRITATVPLDRLTGCLDLEASLAKRAAVLSPGVLAKADGGVLLLAMAERCSPQLAAVLGQTLDRGSLTIERDGVSSIVPSRILLVALDEGADEEEALPASLSDRLGLSIDLSGIALRETTFVPASPTAIAAARKLLPCVAVAAHQRDAIVELCANVSVRRSLFLLRAARALAALAERDAIGDEDIVEAAGLVFGHVIPPLIEDQPAPLEPDPIEEPAPAGADATDDPERETASDAGADMIVKAVQAKLPAGLLAPSDMRRAERGRDGAGGKPFGALKAGTRGRPIGIRQRASPGARLNILATLTAAAPWQGLRSDAETPPIDRQRRLTVRKSDFRYTHYREPRETLAVFAVDASGSSALERLGEAKGAIELLLAECYVRRDQVALIAFGGRGCRPHPAADTVAGARQAGALGAAGRWRHAARQGAQARA